MGIDRGVSSNLRGPLIEVGAVGSRIPTVKGVSVLCRSCLRCRDHAVLRNVASGFIHRRRVLAIDKRHGKCRGFPLGVEHQVGSGHGAEGIRRGQARIGVPTRKGVVAVDATLGSCGSPNVRSFVDVGVELYALDGIEIGAAVVVVDLECVAIVVEVILRHASSA